MFYNPATGKRYSEQTLKREIGNLEGINWLELGIFPLESDIKEKNPVLYGYYENGIIGNIQEGFSLKWEKKERPVGQIKETLVSMAAAKRYAVETGGMMFGGNLVITDRDSQYMISGAVNAVNLDPTRIIMFKTASGFVSLDAVAILALARAVADHVQACFAREGELVDLINQLGTFDDLKKVYEETINEGWPTYAFPNQI